MISMLKNWKGAVEIDGTQYDSVERATSVIQTFSDDMCIRLLHSDVESVNERSTCVKNDASERVSSNTETTRTDDGIFTTDTVYQITVRQYMTKPASPEFDFMAKFNNNIPMPLRTMVGTIEKETRCMVYMKLTGRGLATCTCMRCGRELTNPISRHYGIGPECITKVPVIMHLDINDIAGIKEKLVDVTWEGWIIKSAITNKSIIDIPD